MTIGDFVMYLSFTALMTMPVIQLATIGTQITEAFAGLDRIREIRQMATEDQEDAQRRACPTSAARSRSRTCAFEYNPGVPVLKHVSFHAPAGSTTALVGSSGSGKSTLISLVMAFNRPHVGPRAGRRPRSHDVKLRDYRAHLGVVLQDNFLFDGTIAENIAYAKPHATREEIKAVSRIAHCDEFIEAFEKRYDTIVGERGVRLSGGQRQRVAIARAILAEPAHPDPRRGDVEPRQRERSADPGRTARSLRQGRTTFVIAHRLSTIRSADQILVLEARRDRRARHARRAAGRTADATGSCTTSSTASSATASSTRARISRRNPQPRPNPHAPNSTRCEGTPLRFDTSANLAAKT